MTVPREDKKVFQCRICGKILSHHDEGYRHWVVCVDAPRPLAPVPVEVPV
ncbi:MAG: hypothetical protein AB7T38_02575 [Nitrospirales bacterium]